MPKIKTRTLCRIAILAALYALLTLLSIRAGNLRISFGSLPLVVCALLFGPWQAAAVGLLGEGINQLFYGLTATTVLWLIPSAVRGILIGLAAMQFRGRPSLAERPIPCYAVCVAAAIATTLCNTAVIWLDSVLYHYYTFVYVFGDMALRLLTGVVTALVIASLAQPLVRLLSRQSLVWERQV